jgi:hypothetical protein
MLSTGAGCLELFAAGSRKPEGPDGEIIEFFQKARRPPHHVP